jgi:hypothetical protein
MFIIPLTTFCFLSNSSVCFGPFSVTEVSETCVSFEKYHERPFIVIKYIVMVVSIKVKIIKR